LLKLLEARLKLNEMVKDWKFWSKRIGDAAKSILGQCEVYVFGSVVKGLNVGSSDVDILIVSDNIPERCKERGNLKAHIEEEAGLPLYHPFEIHLATSREAKENPIYRSATTEGIKVC